MNYDSYKEQVIYTCNDIINNCDRMTSGNYMHNINAIKLMAKIIRDDCLPHLFENPQSPWISVEDRLPRACTVPTIEQYIKNQRYWDDKTAATYLVACDSGKYYDFANYIKNGKKCYWAYNDNIIRNVTHWMPIPELPKDE